MTKEGISASHNKEVPIFVVMLNFDILQIVDSPKVWIIRIPDFFLLSFRVVRKSSSYSNWHLELLLDHLDRGFLSRLEEDFTFSQQLDMGTNNHIPIK